MFESHVLAPINSKHVPINLTKILSRIPQRSLLQKQTTTHSQQTHSLAGLGSGKPRLILFYLELILVTSTLGVAISTERSMGEGRRHKLAVSSFISRPIDDALVSNMRHLGAESGSELIALYWLHAKHRARADELLRRLFRRGRQAQLVYLHL